MDESANLQKYIEEKKDLYNLLLNFIDESDSDELNFDNLTEFIKPKNYFEDKEEILHILRLIISIANNHYRAANFFKKIEQIIDSYKNQIKQTLSNDDIFNTIKSNKMILLYFFQNEILTLNKTICNEIIEMNDKNGSLYCHFFIKEIQQNFSKFIDVNKINDIENELLTKEPNLFMNFDEKISKGENDSYICSLIRNDSIEEFISYVNRTNLSLSNTIIENSIFETNSYLLENDRISMIEYAAFYGSIQIFQYLRMNKVELKPSLWFYSIHGRNADLIHLLEENKVLPTDNISTFYINLFIESIKCHHNEFANYFENNFLNRDDLQNENITYNIFHYYNYLYFPLDLVNQSDTFVNLCTNKYDKLVNIVMKLKESEMIDDIKSANESDSAFIKAVNNATKNNKTETVYFLLSTKSEIIESYFSTNKRLNQIAIPSSITSINDQSFRWCSSLVHVSIPSSVTTIGSYSFYGCSSLKRISIPSSVTSVGVSAFKSCKLLSEIEIPSSVQSIGYQAFVECSSLKNVLMFSNCIDCICCDTFESCTSLKQITIPSSVVEIVDGAFSGCISLTIINLPSSLKEIGENAFFKCSSLRQITIPSSVSVIGKGAFCECSSLVQVIFKNPSSLTKIEQNVFRSCTSLKNVTFPNNLRCIKKSAFNWCSSLEEVDLPSSIDVIEYYAFKGCGILKKVVISTKNADIDQSAFPRDTEIIYN